MSKLPSESVYPAQPLPDISTWSNGFSGWSILKKTPNAKEPSGKLGILIAESGLAKNRIFGWATLFAVLAITLGIPAVLDFSNTFVLAGIALCFLAAALYRVATWYLNRDLKVEIFREGFTVRKAAQTNMVYWREVDYVKEHWQKAVHEGIIHIYKHKVEIYQKDGSELELDRSFEKIEEIGRLIQLAVADSRLPTEIEQLKNDRESDFGVFTISRFGIRHKDKNFLPWNQVKSLEVLTTGSTTLKLKEFDSSGWTDTWVMENGGAVKNLYLFVSLSYWFINVAQKHHPNPANHPPTSILQVLDNRDVHYQLLITKVESREGTQKMFYVGTSLQEKELVVKIPAGTPSGTTYHFPDYGRFGTEGGSAGTLTVEILVEQITPLQKRLQELQILFGMVILMGGLIWLGFWSSLDLITNIILAFFIGALGGFLFSIQQRFVGLLSGAIGGVLSYILQFAYYVLMYIFFRRESFWNYESVLVLFISVLPGFGLYKLLQRFTTVKQIQTQ